MPSAVAMTGIWRCSASCRTASEAPDDIVPPPAPDERILRRRQHPCRLRDPARVGRLTPWRLRLEQFYFRDLGQGFRRYLNLNGTGPAVLQVVECFMHRLGNLGRVHRPARELGDRSHDVQLVVHLVEHPPVDADHVALDLARHHHHRRRRCVSGVQGGRGVEQPRTGHHQRGADAAAGPGVPVGHVGGRLLVRW